MEAYPLPLVPGPVRVRPEVLAAYGRDFGSADLEEEFFALYAETAARLQAVLQTRATVVVLQGEGMMALWGALKSVLSPGDRVLAIGTGVFGYGIAEMAAAVGAEVRTVGLDYDRTLGDLTAVEEAIAAFRPKMITVVHCETPSGTLNPLADLGRLKRERGVPLLYVDAVSSVAGAPVLPDAWHIDLCLGGSQKCLAALPDTCFLSVSEAAWEVIAQVKYAGYDALLPFRDALARRFFPYTPCWQATAGLHAAAGAVLAEGLEACFARHAAVAAHCRERLVRAGFALFPAPDAVPSPTVTAVRVPEEIAWPEWDRRLRSRGLVVGGSYGPLAGKVFRLGHMGTQADRGLVDAALDILEEERGGLR
ncbi:MAG: aminotransferase class V-fold PLP-dependent enzyme [Desulfobacterales bacterium]